MKVPRLLSFFCVVLLPLSILNIAGCNNFAEVVRKVTYPPDFKYVSEQELRSHMDQLAFQLQLLDQALANSNTEQPMQQQEVLATLSDIERIGSKLQAGDAGSSHPFLEDFMGDFVSRVSQARNAASFDPPRYYLAGRVAGGCVNCHKVNR
jgi:hypothetical protein